MEEQQIPYPSPGCNPSRATKEGFPLLFFDSESPPLILCRFSPTCGCMSPAESITSAQEHLRGLIIPEAPGLLQYSALSTLSQMLDP